MKAKRCFCSRRLCDSAKDITKNSLKLYVEKAFDVRVDGELREAVSGMKLDRYRTHDIEVVVDKLVVQAKDEKRLAHGVHKTLEQGHGLMMLFDVAADQTRYYSKRLMDPVGGLSYREPAPNNFSFNSTEGACPKCKGLGYVSVIDREKLFLTPRFPSARALWRL